MDDPPDTTVPPASALDVATRRALADLIHDGPVQALAALSLRLQMLAAQPLEAESRDLVAGMQANCASATADLRALMTELVTGTTTPQRRGGATTRRRRAPAHVTEDTDVL